MQQRAVTHVTCAGHHLALPTSTLRSKVPGSSLLTTGQTRIFPPAPPAKPPAPGHRHHRCQARRPRGAAWVTRSERASAELATAGRSGSTAAPLPTAPTERKPAELGARAGGRGQSAPHRWWDSSPAPRGLHDSGIQVREQGLQAGGCRLPPGQEPRCARRAKQVWDQSPRGASEGHMPCATAPCGYHLPCADASARCHVPCPVSRVLRHPALRVSRALRRRAFWVSRSCAVACSSRRTLL